MHVRIYRSRNMKQVKNLHQFTLVLKNVDEHYPGLEDKLFQAGCDDALINFRDGTVYLDFDRTADSFEKAVISAIKAVESALIGASVINIAPENWVTEAEIANRISCKRQTISLWSKDKRRKFFPKPVMKLSSRSPVWSWKDVVEWLYKNNLIDKSEVDKAKFLEDINVVLDERDPATRAHRNRLLVKISSCHNHIAKN